MMKLSIRSLLVIALLVGAAGIALLWLGGVEFPVAIPPGLVILLAGAALVTAVRRAWTAWLGAGLGAFITVGFLLSGRGFDIIGGSEGGVAAAGQVIEVVGALAAVALGVRLGLLSRRSD